MAENNTENKWYVVKAVSGQENKIKTYIENEISRLGMDSFVEQILVPQEKVVQIRNGKKVTKDKTYFPGYIMIKANLTGEVPHIIKSVTNVVDVPVIASGGFGKLDDLEKAVKELHQKLITQIENK